MLVISLLGVRLNQTFIKKYKRKTKSALIVIEVKL